MKQTDIIAAGETVAQVFHRGADAQLAAARLRNAGFSDVRISEAAGTTSEEHVNPQSGQTELDFAALLERAGFDADRAAQVTRAVADGAVLLTVAAGSRAADAAAVLRGETVAAHVLEPVAGPVPAAVSPAVARAGEAAPEHAAPLEAGDRVIPLRAERLDVTKERATSEARIHKEVVTEQRTITVPVQHEQLVIERDGLRDVRIPLGDADSDVSPVR